MGDELLAIDVEGLVRREPLAPTALYVEGEAARMLARRLARRMEVRERETDAQLVGVASRERGFLVVSGPSEALPWCEGARYFGIDPNAPRLRLSTTHAPRLVHGPVLSVSLLERALTQRHPQASGPLILMGNRVIALGHARPLDVSVLSAFAAAPGAPA